jgi:hypothetical protein
VGHHFTLLLGYGVAVACSQVGAVFNRTKTAVSANPGISSRSESQGSCSWSAFPTLERPGVDCLLASKVAATGQSELSSPDGQEFVAPSTSPRNARTREMQPISSSTFIPMSQ